MREGMRPTGRQLVVLALLTVTAVATLGGLLRLKTETGPESFLPSGDPALESLHDSARSFGGDPIVVLAESSKPRQLLGSEQLPKLLTMEGRLSRLPDVAVVYGPATVLNQIAGSSQQLIATLAGRRDAVAAEAHRRASERGASAQEVAAAGERAVANFDQRYAALLVRGLPAGLPTLRNQGFISKVIFDDAGAPKPQWKFVVPAPDTVAILVRPREGLDQEGTEKLVDAVNSTVDRAGLDTERVTVTGVPAVTAGLGSKIRWEMPLLGALAVALIAACYLLVPWIRPKRYRLIPLATTLCATALILAIFGWLNRPLSLGVIAFLPILVGIASDYPAYLTQPGRRRQVIVAALASAAAFASLAISPVPFVRDLGLALACGLLLALGLALVTSGRLTHAEPDPALTPSGPQEEVTDVRRQVTLWQRISALAVAVALATIGWFALPHLDIEAQPNKLAEGLPAMTDIAHAEQVLGGSGEVQVVLRGPEVLAPKALRWMGQAQDEIALRYGSQVRPIVSPPSLLKFLGPSPTPEQIAAGMQLLPAYLAGSVVRDDHQRATMSFLLQLQDLRDQGRVLDGVRSVLPAPPAGYDVELVGLPVVASRGYELVSGSAYLTSTIGIASAGLVLLVGLRRRSEALRAVLAAGLATGWGLAAVAALGMSLTPLTLALGSLTTATACEFTVMLSQASGLRRSQLHRTVVAAAAAAALGFAALSASGLDMVREFGLLLAGTVALSFVAARLVVELLPQTSVKG
jgi:predicted RND superfamily exporter protein